MVPVHIILTPQAADEERVLRALEAAGAENIDPRHLRRLGLVRAEVDPGGLDRLRALEGVQAVREIGAVRAL